MNIITVIGSVILFIVTVYVTSVVITLLKAIIKYQMNKSAYAGLPAYPELFPFGELFRDNGMKLVLERSVDKEGNLRATTQNVGPHLDGTPTCFILDAESFRDVLNEQNFPKLPFVYDALKILLGDGLVTSTGAIWKRERKLLTPLFHLSKLKQMPDIMNYRIQALCKKLKSDNKEYLATSLFGEMTLQIVIDCVFGGERYLVAEEMEPLWKTVNVASNNYFMGELILGKTLNSMSPFPWNFTLRSTMGKIRALVRQAIVKKKEEFNSSLDCNEDTDLLASLLKVRDETTGEAIPEELVIDEALTFLFAGHDTTSSTLSWCMSFLCSRPEVIEKIRQEADEVLEERTAEFEDIKNLSYCENVIKETLRMRPPVPILDRAVREDIEINGQLYKGGTYVYPVFIASHYDNRYWKNPWEFRPERFNKNNKDEPTPHSYAWIPFSGGARNCIGKKFAMIEATLALVEIIRRFDVISSIKEEDIIWNFEGTVKPTNFRCKFLPKK